MQITKKIFRINFIFPCLLCMALSFAQDKPQQISVCPTRNIIMDETGIIITSPLYPEYYGTRVDCRLGLEIPPNKILKITLTNFTTFDARCDDNILVMFTDSWWYQNCGNVIPDEMNIDTDSIDRLLKVTYKTDKSVIGRRFSMTFKLVDKSRGAKGLPDVFTSPSRWSTPGSTAIMTTRVKSIIASAVGVCVFLSIVLTVLFVKYKRRKRPPRLPAPVDIPLEAVETPPESLPIDEEPVSPCYEMIPETEVPNRNANVALGYSTLDTKLDKQQDIFKKGTTDGSVCQAHLKEDTGYVIPAPEEPQYETPGAGYEEPKISPENPGYTELDKNRLQGRNATDDGTYQKLVKRDSDYVIPAHERRESYEDIRMGRNLPGYTELDLSKRETEESQRSAYQKLVKT